MFADHTIQQGISPVYAWAALVIAVTGLLAGVGAFLRTMKELGSIKQNVDGKMTALQTEVTDLRALISKSVYKQQPVSEKAALAILPASTQPEPDKPPPAA